MASRCPFQDKRDMCQEHLWAQDDYGCITYNVSTGYMTIWHYHNGKCNLQKALKCLEKLNKQLKIEKKGEKWWFHKSN